MTFCTVVLDHLAKSTQRLTSYGPLFLTPLVHSLDRYPNTQNTTKYDHMHPVTKLQRRPTATAYHYTSSFSSNYYLKDSLRFYRRVWLLI